MKNNIFICGIASPDKVEIFNLVRDYFSKSPEFVLSQDSVQENEREDFAVYLLSDEDDQNHAIFSTTDVYAKFYDLCTGRRRTEIAGQIIVDYMAWCREKGLTVVDH